MLALLLVWIGAQTVPADVDAPFARMDRDVGGEAGDARLRRDWNPETYGEPRSLRYDPS